MTDCEGCRGCMSFTSPDGFTPFCMYDNYADKCPCVRCVVKMMCENSCPDFEIFRDLVIKLDKNCDMEK